MFSVSPLELDMLAKTLFASFLGFMIGIERQGGPKGAGLRTFCLICTGSALFTVLSVSAFPASIDQTRIIAQVVSGIGFIGAGVIWRQREEAVHGITTAAAIWVSAAVGVAAGLGLYVLSSSITVIIMIILAKGHPLKEAKENLKYNFGSASCARE
ncbi:MAG: MgtC/SapB family protein [Candidatus Altiarchaeota archaeon]